MCIFLGGKKVFHLIIIYTVGYLCQVEWGDVDWIGLAQDRDRLRDAVNAVMNIRVS
jgi:hypothetical protein